MRRWPEAAGTATVEFVRRAEEERRGAGTMVDLEVEAWGGGEATTGSVGLVMARKEPEHASATLGCRDMVGEGRCEEDGIVWVRASTVAREAVEDGGGEGKERGATRVVSRVSGALIA